MFARTCPGVAAVAAFVLLASCSARDPGIEYLLADNERSYLLDGGVARSTDASPASSPTLGDAAAAVTAFGGAPAFSADSPPSPGRTAAQAHAGKANIPQQPGSKDACLTCHGGTGTAPGFAFAGTVLSGSSPLANAEVRVVSARGEEVGRAKSDADGNFWFRGGGVSLGALTGVRSASKVALMTSSLVDGNCNAGGACHGGSAGAIHLD